MRNDILETFFKKANELKKNYKWLQAANTLQKTSIKLLKNNRLLKTAEVQGKIGFCFYRAAFQAKTNSMFRKRLRLAVKAYEKEIRILNETKEDKQVEINHAIASVAYIKSWLEKSPWKTKELLAKWWTLENQVLAAYERAGDLHSIGRICNNLIEYANYSRYWLASDYSETMKISNDCFVLAEKAIQILTNLDDDYELARTYCFSSWYYSWSQFLWESEEESRNMLQKSQEYANKALELSRKTGDAWLIGWSYISVWSATFFGAQNPDSALDYGQRVLEYGRIASDNFLMGFGNLFVGRSIENLAKLLEDPDKQKEGFEKAKKMFLLTSDNFQLIQYPGGLMGTYHHLITTFSSLAEIETDQKNKQAILEMALEISEEGTKRLEGWALPSGYLLKSLSVFWVVLSEAQSEIDEERKLLFTARSLAKRNITFRERFRPFAHLLLGDDYYQLALVQERLAGIESDLAKKIELLNNTVMSLKKSIKLLEKKKTLGQTVWASGFYFGRYYDKLGRVLQQVYSLTKEEERLSTAIEVYKNAIFAFEKADLPTHTAEANWHLAQVYSQLGNHQISSKYFESASETFKIATAKIPQLKDFYTHNSLYMQAWSQIEQARYNHSIEEYEKAKQNYKNSAELHESIDHWSYLASNYFAWANMEEAEGLSRREISGQAKEAFQKALEQFSIAEKSIKRRIEDIESSEEKDLTRRLLQSLDLRRRFCQARIQIENAKLLDREGKYLQSSKSYKEAAQNIQSIVEKVESAAERKELDYLATLCRAWEKMAVAEETTSSESYIEAARIFEQAKEHCYTKKASLWALGNSSFCRGLAAGIRYRITTNLSDNALAKRHIKNAASSYLGAGLKTASEYARATLRLFDAYVFMNQAESEVDPEQKTKQYQMAENLLQLAAGSFMKAKQPEKTAQVQQIIKTVREEKTLAVSLAEVMHAPTITSSTITFTAPSPTSEVSVGLEQFQHANVQANLIAGRKEVKVGESFCLTVEFVNAGKEPALLTRVEDFVPADFIVVKKPDIYRLEDSCLNMKGKQIAPLKLVEAKLVLQPSKKGVYQLKPIVHYLDELGQNKSLQLKSVEIKVEEVVLADRVPTGTRELDSLLLGGIPEEYAVVLTGSPSDERTYLIKNFLEAGTKEDEIVFYVTTEADGLENFLKNPNFHLFLCNPKPKTKVPDLPNVTKLRSKTDINNLSMALARTSRNAAQKHGIKRVCIELVSDVLLEYGSKTTRKWLAELITELTSKGFTLLAVINPEMHTPDQTGAILDLFDGEISITQTGDPLECKKSIIVKKLRGQDYIKNPICLKM